MSVFLVSLITAAPDPESVLPDDINVLRRWDTPGPSPDFLVVQATARDRIVELAQRSDTPVRGATEIVLEGAAGAADSQLDAILPRATPRALTDFDPVGWLDPQWVWCDPCRDMHAPGEHTR